MIGENIGAARANAAYREKRKSTEKAVPGEDVKQANGPAKPKKRTKAVSHKKITRLDVTEFIRKNDIKSQTHLMAAAETRRECGDRALAEFVLKMSQRS